MMDAMKVVQPAAATALVLLAVAATRGQVLSGLEIEARGAAAVVHPGVVRVEGKDVRIDQAVTLPVTAPGYRGVADEEYVLSSDVPQTYAKGTHLRGCCFGADGPGTVLPGCLVPGSVVVKLADGTTTEAGRDYRIDEKWAALSRIDGGRIASAAAVRI